MEFVTDISIPENSEAQQIQIVFDRPAPVAGTINIEVTPSNATGFTTTPAITGNEIQLQVEKGATEASFTFDSEDDEELQGNREINFLLQEDSDFLVGDKQELIVTIFEDEVAATVNFSWLTFDIKENETEELGLPIEFSVPVPGDATIKVKVEGEGVENYLTTVPPMDANNIIELSVPSGVWKVEIGLQPKNNAVLNNHQDIQFSIVEVSGPITKGDRLELDLRLKDDELVGKLQSVQIVEGSNEILKTIEYDSGGRISKVLSEENASGVVITQNYSYDNEDRLTGISTTPGDGEYLTWENDKIVKTEKMTGFFGTSQSYFEYENGKLVRKRDFDLDSNRNATETDRYTYTYHTSGNLKSLVHTSLVNGVWLEISIRTYDSYSEVTNPFPLEAAPGLYLQEQLNSTLMIKQNNSTQNLYYSHTFNEAGKVVTRQNGQEVITYSYY